jgi:hypothetical protein
MIFFTPIPFVKRGVIRTLHHEKERLSFYSAGAFLYEKTTPAFFVITHGKDTFYLSDLQINNSIIQGKRILIS